MSSLFRKFLVLLLAMPLTAMAADDGFVFEGNVMDAGGNPIITPVDIQVEILGAASCVLYTKVNSAVDPSDDGGFFTVTIDGTGATLNGPANFAGVFGSGTFCATAHTSSSPRSLRLSFRPAGGGAYEPLTEIAIKSVPFAIKAKEAYAINPEADQNFNAHKITNLATPTNPQDAATMAYVIANSGTGTVTSVATGAGLTGGTITGAGTIALATSGVGAGQYTKVTVDIYGRVTAATTLSAGDIPATDILVTAPLVWTSGTKTMSLNVPTCTGGQVLFSNGTNFSCVTDNAGAAAGDATYTAKGLVQFDTNANTSGVTVAAGLAKLATVGAPNTYGSASEVPVLTTDIFGRVTGVTNTTITGGGDVTGNVNALTVTKIRNTNINITALVDDNLLMYNGVDWVNRLVPSCNPNEYLTFNGTAWNCVADVGAAGVVTQVIAGTGLNVGAGPGGTITNTGTLNLASTGVIAGSYGIAGSVPTIGVDAQGRIISAIHTPIVIDATAVTGTMTVAQGGTGLGALCGVGQILKSNGTNYVCQSDAGITGTGNVDKFAKFTAAGAVGDSLLEENAGMSELSFNAIRFASNRGTRNLFLGNSGNNTFATGPAIDNIMLGNGAGSSLTVGFSNILMGTNAGSGLTASPNNIAIGNESLMNNSNSTGDNVAVGRETMRALNGTGSNGRYNVAVGTQAMRGVTLGSQNTALGYGTLGSIGTYNMDNSTAVGAFALNVSNPGAFNGNDAFGSQSLILATTGMNNVAIGAQTLSSLTTGSDNTAIGNGAGVTANSTSSGNIFVGTDAGPATFQTLTSKLYIDNIANNTPLIGGDFAANTVDINGTLNIAFAGSFFNYQPNGAECSNDEVLKWNAALNRWVCGTNVGGVTGIVPIANGGTNSSTPLNGNRIVISTSALKIQEAPAMTDGQLLIGSTGAVPVVGNITNGTGISVLNGTGTISISSTLTGMPTTCTMDQLAIYNGPSWGCIDGAINNVNGTVVKRDNNGDFFARDIGVRNVIFSGGTAFKDGDSNLITLQAPANATADYTLRLPAATGSAGTMLVTDGAGNLSWKLVPMKYDASGNTGVGDLAQLSIAGSANTALGFEAMRNSVGIFSNTAIGRHSMYGLTSGAGNVAVGSGSMEASSAGSANVAIGQETLRWMTAGGNNVGVGSYAGNLMATGSNNVLVGSNAGATLTNTSGNIFLGNRAGELLTTTNTFVVNNTNDTINPLMYGTISGTASQLGIARAPAATLDVGGAIRTGLVDVPSGTAANLALGNTVIFTAPGAPSLSFTNALPGASYTIIINDTTSRMYTFAGLGCGSIYYSPANTTTTVSSRTVYKIDVTPTACFIDWKSGYL